MGATNIIAPMLFIAGVAAVVLAAVAIVQDLRNDRKYGYRQAFYTIVSMVMLVMAVASVTSIITITLKASVLPKADNSFAYSYPPGYFRTVAPSCTKDCLFTADDKVALAEWKTSYVAWKSEQAKAATKKGLSQQLRQDLAGSLAVLIVTLPLYFLFAGWMNRGAKAEFKVEKRPSPLRSVYFYGVALAGLIMGVVAAAMLINTGLKIAFQTTDTSTSPEIIRPAGPDMGLGTDKSNIQRVIDCAEKCDFTADDVSLAKQWLVDNTAAQTSSYNPTQTDLANTIPLFLLGAPLFWFHFARIRKETSTS